MSVITNIDLGAVPNDGTGTPARNAGQIINDNFDNLNGDKLEGITSNNGQVTIDNSDPINPELNIPNIVSSVSAGSGISVDNSDPANPEISATGGSITSEDGNLLPYLEAVDSNAVATYTFDDGDSQHFAIYSKNGENVLFSMTLRFDPSALGTGIFYLNLTGLPLNLQPTRDGVFPCILSVSAANSNFYSLVAQLDASASRFQFRLCNNFDTGNADVLAQDVQHSATSELHISGVWYTGAE